MMEEYDILALRMFSATLDQLKLYKKLGTG